MATLSVIDNRKIVTDRQMADVSLCASSLYFLLIAVHCRGNVTKGRVQISKGFTCSVDHLLFFSSAIVILSHIIVLPLLI